LDSLINLTGKVKILSYKILIVEDEENIRKIIRDYFCLEGFEVVEAENGRQGVEFFSEGEFDAVILDIMMPELDGWTVCRRIRKVSDLPIIMLTARTEEEDELMGFELKADDYVKKPFSPAVLVARVTLLLSKQRINKNESGKVEKYGITVDKYGRTVEINESLVELTQKEFDIFLLLFTNEKNVFTREQILDSIWGYDYYGDIRIVDNHIKKIRKSFGEKAYYIRTVFGVGYKFEVKE
jgi:DNA-binding response OmpR family regulator